MESQTLVKTDYVFEGDYRGVFIQFVDELYEVRKDISRQRRINLIDEVTGYYIEQTGEVPAPYQLSRLSSIILDEEISNPDPYKVLNTEYPFQSPSQLDRRRGTMLNRKRKDIGTHFKEVPLSHASSLATNGFNYTLPIRYFGNPW